MLNEAGVNPEHNESLQETTEYIHKHRLPELFNELLAKMLFAKVKDPKAELLKQLKNIQKIKQNSDPHDPTIYHLGEPLLDEKDFESIFDSLDVLQTG